MQKKLLAVAVAGALGAPVVAMAQTSTVQIFGTMYIEYSYNQQGIGGAAPLNRREKVDILQSPGSEIGFKGEEKLGGGLSAWFQCSSTADIRGQSPEGFCSRNSALGLKGGFGNVFIGRWDTPFKRSAAPTSVGANETGVFGSAFLLAGNATSTLDASNRGTFLRRQANMISYDSPTFGGFQIMAGYSSTNGSTGSTTGITNSKPRVMSLGAQYSAGPLFVSAGYERHSDFGNVAGAGPTVPAVIAGVQGGAQRDTGWHAGAAYTWGPVRVGGKYMVNRYENASAPETSARYRAWHLGVDWTIVGPHGLRAAWTHAQDAKGNATIVGGTTNGLFASGYRPAPCFGATAATVTCSDTGADLYQVRYVYTFSKRTEFTGGYVLLSNDSRAGYSIGGLAAPNIGQNQHSFAIALRHTF